MSLNGLNAPAITDAYQFFQDAAAGWLLLKYATRDEIELYGFGAGGTSEIAAKVGGYEEKSPLYGLVAHNHKRVLLRYVPQGTSRLLQARVKVHFESLASHFEHDSDLSISNADELTDETIATSSQGASAPSPSSHIPNATSPTSSSFEGTASAASGFDPTSATGNLTKEEDDNVEAAGSRTARLLAEVRAGKMDSHEVLAALKITSTRDSEIPSPESSHQLPERHSSSDSTDSAERVASNGPMAELSQFPVPRISTSSAEAYSHKPKVKVGPRPAQSPESQAGSRSVASLPAGIIMPTRAPQTPSIQTPSRPSSSRSSNAPFRAGENGMFPIVQSPGSIIQANFKERRPSSQSGSIIRLPMSLDYGSASSQKSPKDDMTPEKARLMKALELRKKQQAKHKANEEASTPQPSPETPDAETPTSANGHVMENESGSSIPASSLSPFAATEAVAEHRLDVVQLQPAAGHGVGTGSNAEHADPTPAVDSLGTLPPAQEGTGTAPDESPGIEDIADSHIAVSNGAPNASRDAGKQVSNGDSSKIDGEGNESHLPQKTEAASVPSQKAPPSTTTTPAHPSSSDDTRSQELFVASESTDNPLERPVGEPQQGADADHPPGESIAPPPTIAAIKSPGPEVNSQESCTDSAVPTRSTGRKAVSPSRLDARNSSSIETEARDRGRSRSSRIHSQYSADVSISTSLSGASFLEELEDTPLEEAQHVTLVKSLVTSSVPRSSGFTADLSKEIGQTLPTAVAATNTAIESQGEAPESRAVAQEPEAAVQAQPQVRAEPEPTSAPAATSEIEPASVSAPEPAPEPVSEPALEPALKPAPEHASEQSSEPALEPVSNPAPEQALEQASEQAPKQASKPAPEQASEQASEQTSEQTSQQISEQTSEQISKPLSAPAPAPETAPEIVPRTAPLQASLADDITVTSPPEPKAVSSPVDEASIPLDESPTSGVKGSSPASKKHPKVNPPHIWGGPLRAASNPIDGPPRHLSPGPDLAKLSRSASMASDSGAMLRPDSPSGMKKSSVGSRIADRIKALEKSSGGAGSSGPVYAHSSVSVRSRKSSFNTPPGSSGTDTIRNGPYPTSAPSPASNIFTRRFGSVRNVAASESGLSDSTIRASQADNSNKSASNSYAGLASSLRGSATPSPNELQIPSSRPSYFRQTSTHSSTSLDSPKPSSIKTESVPPSREGPQSPTKRTSFSSSRVSRSGQRNSTDATRSVHSRQSSVDSTGTASGDKKKDSAAKKLMKRVSGAFSPRRERHNPITSPTLSSEPIMEEFQQEPPSADDTTGGMVSRGSARAQSKPVSSSNIVVGEVNVQFPDNLLWKRRHMELDGSGSIVLSASRTDGGSGKSSSTASRSIVTKSYPIADFRPPYVPDQDREELPFSIILDFMDSSTLQCACQNATDQMNVLAALLSFHTSFAGQER